MTIHFKKIIWPLYENSYFAYNKSQASNTQKYLILKVLLTILNLFLTILNVLLRKIWGGGEIGFMYNLCLEKKKIGYFQYIFFN